jgi:pyruvate dehydrogenase E2 component (dihydrolipoamide acetyltransferase)
MTEIDVRIPNIGDFHDLPIIAVLVKVGDAVALESPLVELESEKATMEVPSPAAGVVSKLTVQIGDKVSEGSTILTLTPANGASAADSPGAGEAAAPGASDASGGGAPAGAAAAAATPAPAATQPSATDGVAASSNGAASADSATAAQAPVASAAIAPAAPPAPLEPAPASAGTVHASPSIRRFARELGVDLHAVKGSGPHARVTREDVQSFVKESLARAASAPAKSPAGGGAIPLDLPPWPKPDFAQFGEIERVPLSRIRKISGPVLHRNWMMIPHVTNNDEADVTELEAFRKKCNAENPAAKITMLAFAVKACVAALKAFPDVNSSLDGDELILKRYYNIGFAADTPNGLVVPVLKNADRKGVLEIATESAALAKKARDGKLGMADMSGATFTISSLGGIGGTSFSPIVNAPEVAILGLSRSAIKPVWDGSAFVPRLMLPLSLSYDHRVIDGALAARFNAYLVNLLADLRRVLL